MIRILSEEVIDDAKFGAMKMKLRTGALCTSKPAIKISVISSVTLATESEPLMT